MNLLFWVPRAAVALALFAAATSICLAADTGQLPVVVVRDNEGHPARRAKIEYVSLGSNARIVTSSVLSRNRQTTTDAAGRASLDMAPDDSALVHVTAGRLGGWFTVETSITDTPITIGTGSSVRFVVRDEDGKPLRGALAIVEDRLPVGRTDRDGKITLRNRGGSTWMKVTLFKEGYKRCECRLDPEPTHRVLVCLERDTAACCPVLHGKVVDSAGHPVPHAEVFWDEVGIGQADRRGRFKIRGILPESKVTLDARAPDGCFGLGAGQSVETASVPPQGLTLTLPDTEGPGRTLRGRVVLDRSDTAVQGTVTVLTGDRWASFLKTTLRTEDDGSFVLDRIQHDYARLSFVPDDPCLYPLERETTLELADPRNLNVRLAVGRGTLIRGRVLSDSGAPVKDVSVHAVDASCAKTDSEGRFELLVRDAVEPISGLGVTDCSGRNSPKAIAPVKVGEVRDGVELRITPSETSLLEGVVVDPAGQPIPGVSVRFESKGGDRTEVSSDEEGRLSARFSRPAAVEVSVGSRTQALSPMGDRDAFTQFPVIEGNRFSVGEAEHQSIRIVAQPIPTRSLALRAIDQEGRPVRAHTEVYHGTTSDAAGETNEKTGLIFIELPQPPYAIHVTAIGYKGRVLFSDDLPGADNPERTVVLDRGPFGRTESVWETITGRPATPDAVASTPFGDQLRKREPLFALMAYPLAPKRPEARPKSAEQPFQEATSTKPASPKSNPQVDAGIAGANGDSEVPSLEKTAADETLPRAARLSALLALGRIGSERSAAAYARLRDAAYAKSGAPAKRNEYTHVERMTEAAIMTLSTIAGDGEDPVPRVETAPYNCASVNNDYKTGSLRLGLFDIRLVRVGAEWMVTEWRKENELM